MKKGKKKLPVQL